MRVGAIPNSLSTSNASGTIAKTPAAFVTADHEVILAARSQDRTMGVPGVPSGLVGVKDSWILLKFNVKKSLGKSLPAEKLVE